MRRSILLFKLALAAILSLCASADATININVDAVQKSVVFLYAADAQGDVDESSPIGTGFLVGIPLVSDPKRSYAVLVTARHMVDATWAKCPGTNPSVIYMRLNKKSYTPSSSDVGFDFVPMHLTDQGIPTWRHHADEDIDAAVVPLPKDLGQDFDLVLIPVEFFPTDSELASQSIGDPVMSAGLMPALPGIRRNYPIFKFGQISNIPSEDVETRCTPQQPTFFVKVWLIASNLVPGNSGSPIFHVPLGGSGVMIGGTRPMLLGVQSMSFAGADIAGMTPINFVYEILQCLPFSDADLHRGPVLPSTQPAQK
jgi:hypothetical protein